MPTYLYECEKCGRFEEFQKITAPALEKCPECGKEVKRIIGAPGVIFKGSGFYSTDNRSSNVTKSKDLTDNKEVKSEKSSKDSGDKKGNSSTEEKVS